MKRYQPRRCWAFWSLVTGCNNQRTVPMSCKPSPPSIVHVCSSVHVCVYMHVVCVWTDDNTQTHKFWQCAIIIDIYHIHVHIHIHIHVHIHVHVHIHIHTHTHTLTHTHTSHAHTHTLRFVLMGWCWALTPYMNGLHIHIHLTSDIKEFHETDTQRIYMTDTI